MICPTRDVFQARLDTFYGEVERAKIFPESETALLVAVAGEIGNNCFDHNLGQWQDQHGCWFSWEKREGEIVCAISDRGQGLLNSLKRVRPDLKDEETAVKLAFEKKISGRSPEQRGNGLKFVRSVINGHQNRGLLFYSGSGEIRFGGSRRLEVEKPVFSGKIGTKKGTGTFAVLFWNEP